MFEQYFTNNTKKLKKIERIIQLKIFILKFNFLNQYFSKRFSPRFVNNQQCLGIVSIAVSHHQNECENVFE